MKPAVVVDTNVPVVANGRADHAGLDCEEVCIDFLEGIRRSSIVLVDDAGLILGEYRRKLDARGQPGMGDAFFKWLWDRRANPDHCRRVRIVPHPVRKFEEFPDDPALMSFDSSDRKFVAVALADGQDAVIVNASDTDWWNLRKALERHGVRIRFLCPDLMVRGSRIPAKARRGAGR